MQSIRIIPRIDCVPVLEAGLVRALSDVLNAMDRKKSGWTRAKKIRLIEEQNPSWSDLSEARRER